MSGNIRKNQVTRLVTLRHRSTMSGALGLRGGIFTATIPASARTASNDAVNCLYRFKTNRMVSDLEFVGSAKAAR